MSSGKLSIYDLNPILVVVLAHVDVRKLRLNDDVLGGVFISAEQYVGLFGTDMTPIGLKFPFVTVHSFNQFEIVLIFNAEIIVSANFDHGGSPDVSGVETNDRVVDFTLLLQHV